MSMTFKDNEGRVWTVTIDVAAAKRVRRLVEVDLMDAVSGTLIETLVNDPVTLADVIYAVVKPQADERGVSDDNFGAALAGDSIEYATAALLEGLIAFFPKAKRDLLAKAIAKFEMVQHRAIEAAHAYLESPDLNARLDEELRSLGISSTSVPESSD